MAIRDKMRANGEAFLEPHETLQVVFGAQTVSQYLVIVSVLLILFTNVYRVVLVTDKRILVCRSGRMVTTPVREVVRELPRSTRIGPVSGVVWSRCDTLGETLYIHKRFHKDVAAADQMAA